MADVQISQSEEYSDDQGESEVQWRELPQERDFFASPYDPPIKSLVQELREGELIARPDFQRYQVWDIGRKSKFVESILLNIPIPTLFFADDENRKLVVDGQQRLLALKEYLDNSFALKKLEVLAPLNGKRFDALTSRQQRLINNRTLRCLVISAKSDSEIRFQVFERLNQGGVALNPQEVRHCVYRGELNNLLHELVNNKNWLYLYGRVERHPRMVDCELVLRYFALKNTLPIYSPPLKQLLTTYMRDHRHPDEAQVLELRGSFLKAVQGVRAVFSNKPFRSSDLVTGEPRYDRNINRAVFDIQMLTSGLLPVDWLTDNRDAVRSAFEDLCSNDEVFIDSVSRATANKKNFDYRLNRWATALTSLGAKLKSPDLIPNAP